jgi:hypothetical protein
VSLKPVLLTNSLDYTGDNLSMVSLKAVADLTLVSQQSLQRYDLTTCVVDSGGEFATGVAALLWLVSTPTFT